MVDNSAEVAAVRKTVKEVFFPTVESCWDYGIARNAPLLPFIGSLLPYSFLRGVQFDTKVFKIWEFVESIKKNGFDIVSASNARNEIKLVMNRPAQFIAFQKLYYKLFGVVPETKFTADGSIVTSISSPSTPEAAEEAINLGYGTSINIAVDGDSSLEYEVTNKWGGGEDIITQVLQGGAEIIKNLSEMGRTVNQSTTSNDTFATVPFSPKRYQGSEFGDLTITFTLFTRNNFLRDIYIPLLFLKGVCVPSKFDDKDASELLAQQLERLKNAVVGTQDENIKKANEEVQSRLAQISAGILNERLKVVEPPPTFSVEHSSGLFFMEKAGITRFNFKPEGPWVRVEYDGLFGKIFGAAGAPNVATALDRLLQDVYIKFPNYPSGTYPTRVKCSLTLKELNFITKESFTSRENKKIAKILVSTAQIATDPGTLTSAYIAGGIAQSLDVLIPDTKGAGDLLSGGKWVPPGESMSGIPGFL
jgi:hypothetical protein